MARTCAICGGRDATTETEWEDRIVPACARCDAEVPDFEYQDKGLRERVMSALRWNPGSTLGEVCDMVDVASGAATPDKELRSDVGRAYDAVMSHLRRLVAKGYAAAEGVKGGGMKYTLATPERIAEIDRQLADARRRYNESQRDKRVRQAAHMRSVKGRRTEAA